MRYNLALVVAGFSAFVCYVVVCFTLLPRVLDESEIEVSVFTTLFQGIGYLFMMGVANIVYFIGAVSESIVKPRNVERYRLICYRFGFWFSFLLPFCIPLLLAAEVVLSPGRWGHHR